MSDDGGPANEMSLRELYAIILEAAHTLGQDGEPDSLHVAAIFDEAQVFTNEAMRRRGQDNAKRLAEGAEAMKNEYVDGSEVERVTR